MIQPALIRNPPVYVLVDLRFIDLIEDFMAAQWIDPQGHVRHPGLFECLGTLFDALPVAAYRIVPTGDEEYRQVLPHRGQALWLLNV